LEKTRNCGEKQKMTKPKVDVLPITEGATPDPLNVNKHTQRGGGMLENSLRKRGAFRSIASAGKGVDVPVVYAGNYTLEKAVSAGFDEIVNVHVTGNQLVNVVRDDLAPSSAEAIALGLEDNEIGKQSYNPDLDILAAVISSENSIISELRIQDRIFDDLVEDVMADAGIVGKEKIKERTLEIRPRNMLHILISVNSDNIESVMTVKEAVGQIENADGIEVLYGAN